MPTGEKVASINALPADTPPPPPQKKKKKRALASKPKRTVVSWASVLRLLINGHVECCNLDAEI